MAALSLGDSARRLHRGVASPVVRPCLTATSCRSATLNSEKSGTYRSIVVKSIIGVKPVAPQAAAAPHAVPEVRRVQVDEGSEGQRLDNFLVKLLKGVPKTHVYRVIRSGEIGRASCRERV